VRILERSPEIPASLINPLYILLRNLHAIGYRDHVIDMLQAALSRRILPLSPVCLRFLRHTPRWSNSLGLIRLCNVIGDIMPQEILTVLELVMKHQATYTEHAPYLAWLLLGLFMIDYRHDSSPQMREVLHDTRDYLRDCFFGGLRATESFPNDAHDITVIYMRFLHDDVESGDTVSTPLSIRTIQILDADALKYRTKIGQVGIILAILQELPTDFLAQYVELIRDVLVPLIMEMELSQHSTDSELCSWPGVKKPPYR
jgi:hypothetical protein